MHVLNSYSTPDSIEGPFAFNNFPKLSKGAWLPYVEFHSLARSLAPLSFIGRDSWLAPVLDNQQQVALKSLGLTLSFTKDYRPVFLSTQNPEFVEQLTRLGFFNVFNTNSGKFGVQLSQVLMFLEYGIQWVRNGFRMSGNLYNIHHLNQDVLDNRPHNLDVLPVDLHSFVTSLQVGRHGIPTDLYSTRYIHSVSSKAPLTTKDGRAVKTKAQWVQRLSQVVRATLVASTLFCLRTMELAAQCSDLSGASSDQVTLFGALLQLGQGLGLVPKVASFLKGKDIPSLDSIQTRVGSWFRSFKASLEPSRGLLFGPSLACA